MFRDMIQHSVRQQRNKRSALAEPTQCPLCLRCNSIPITAWLRFENGKWKGKAVLFCEGCGKRYSWARK